MNGIECSVDILDSSGDDVYLENLLNTWISYSNGFILIYSIDSRDSFEQIKIFYKAIMSLKDNPYIILLGNKADLDNSKRVISYNEGKDLSTIWNIDFYEISCLENN